MTTNATDATGYHKNVSNTETVDVTIERLSGTSPLSVAGVFHRGLTFRESQSSGVQIGSQTRVWNLPNANMQGQELRHGDRVAQSDGTAWKIIDAVNLSFGSRWRCITVKERRNDED